MQTENQTMKKICFLIFVLFIIASCSPNQDINGDYLRGVSYSSNGGTNSTIKNVKTVTTVDAAGDKMFNAMEETSSKGGGTAAFQDGWETLDQLIMSSSLLDSDLSSYKLYQTNVFMPSYLIQPSGEYKGYPFRTFSFGKFAGGYSDHFPVYLYLIKK